MSPDPQTSESKGQPRDLWDDGLPLPFLTRDPDRPVKLSWVLLAVVGLLSIEWLIRKLLRLA
jgi:hypothetical protein